MLSQGQGGDPQEVGKKLEDGLLPRGPARRGREPGPGPTCQRFAWPSGFHFTISPRGHLAVWAESGGGAVPRYTVTRALLPTRGTQTPAPWGSPARVLESLSTEVPASPTSESSPLFCLMLLAPSARPTATSPTHGTSLSLCLSCLFWGHSRAAGPYCGGVSCLCLQPLL